MNRHYRNQQVGTGTARSGHSGLIDRETGVGNVDAGVDTLASYSLPADTLQLNTCVLLRITAYGHFATNGNNKEVILAFGGTNLYDSGVVTHSNANWMVEAYVRLTSAGAQVAMAKSITNTTVAVTRSAPAETESGAIVIKVTGEGVASDDITCDDLIIEALPKATF